MMTYERRLYDINERIRAIIMELTELSDSIMKSEGTNKLIKIGEILKELGIPPHISGYNYIKQAVLIRHTLGKKYEIVRDIYSVLTPDNYLRSERAIRYAINIAYLNNPDRWREILGNSLKVKPTNKNVITCLEIEVWGSGCNN